MSLALHDVVKNITGKITESPQYGNECGFGMAIILQNLLEGIGRDKIHGNGVQAITQASGRRAVIKHMAKMTAAV